MKRLILLALVTAGCGHLDGRPTSALSPTAGDSTPRFTVTGPIGCMAATALPAQVQITIAMYDAGDSGIDHFDRFVGHDRVSGCAPTYQEPHAERIHTTGSMSYRPHEASESIFLWSKMTESCGRSWVVVTASRPTPPVDIVITSFAVNYGVDCPS